MGKTVARKFSPGLELGTIDASRIMSRQYTHLIGIVGLSNAGKTCLLSSLYLLVSNGELEPEYMFAGSKSLRGFEARARGLRRWRDGKLPEKLVERTSLIDPRSPAFMHIALVETRQSTRRVELLLSDLPGEWFSDLIDQAYTAQRLDFLTRADGLIFVIDGQLLELADKRHLEIHRNELLLERLLFAVGVDKAVPLVLLVSKSDLLTGTYRPAVDTLASYATGLGFRPYIISAAAFSSRPDKIKSGAGVIEAINEIIRSDRVSSARNPEVKSTSSLNRAIARFGGA